MSATSLPWSDCKVAFDCADPEKLWAAHDAGTLQLPAGWKLVGTDCSGARCVALVRVNGLPTIKDAEAARAAITNTGNPS